jgi:indole-3-glycerol phosphate synthase
MTWTPRHDHAASGQPGRGLPEGSNGAPSVLADIVASVRSALPDAKARMPRAELERLARDRTPRAGLFVEALSTPGRINVIAECKRRSPSAGILRAQYRPGRIAKGYERSGAAAISVVTEPTFFGGALDHLSEVRRAVDLPVLRKDFIVDAYQLIEARAAGADAVLLIAAAVDDRALGNLIAEARRLGLAALVEVHDESDLRRAIEGGATVIGVNNRSLRTLEVDLATSERLVGRLPKGAVAVAESGIRSPEDLVRLRECGYHAFLIGGHFMASLEPGAALADLLRAADSAPGPAGGDA